MLLRTLELTTPDVVELPLGERVSEEFTRPASLGKGESGIFISDGTT